MCIIVFKELASKEGDFQQSLECLLGLCMILHVLDGETSIRDESKYQYDGFLSHTLALLQILFWPSGNKPSPPSS